MSCRKKALDVPFRRLMCSFTWSRVKHFIRHVIGKNVCADVLCKWSQQKFQKCNFKKTLWWTSRNKHLAISIFFLSHVSQTLVMNWHQLWAGLFCERTKKCTCVSVPEIRECSNLLLVYTPILSFVAHKTSLDWRSLRSKTCNGDPTSVLRNFFYLFDVGLFRWWKTAENKSISATAFCWQEILKLSDKKHRK